MGFTFGVLFALALPGHGADYRATVALLVGLGFAAIGALSAGAIATRADGRDPRAHTQAWNPLDVPELPEPVNPPDPLAMWELDGVTNKDG